MPEKPHPLKVIRRAQGAGCREVIVAYSGGKDATVTLDLCLRHFDRVEAYFYCIAPVKRDGSLVALPYEEKQLQWAERRYGVEIYRVPHPSLTSLFRQSTYRHGTMRATDCPRLLPIDLDAHLRKRFGIQWIATGERAQDSLERNAFIRETGGVDRLDDEEQKQRDEEFKKRKGREKPKQRPRFRLYPIGFWSEGDVFSYIQQRGLVTSSVYKIADDEHFRSRTGKKKEFGGLQMDTIAFMQKNMPEDYAQIKRLFPLIDAQVIRFNALMKAKNAKQVPEV